MQILVYDGQCNMCSSFIRFVVRINKNPDLMITDFNSDWVRENLLINLEIDSIIFITEDKEFIYSDGIIHLLASANKIYLPLLLLKAIPRIVRDNVYKIVARNRRKINFQKACPVPSKKAREMFLP